MSALTPAAPAVESIASLRGRRVILDADLAALYGLIIKYQTGRWDLSRAGAKAAAPATKTATAKRAAHAAG